MATKRIVHLISELDIGGAEQQLGLIVPQLQKHLDNHVVCMIGHGVIGQQLQAKGITVHYLDLTGRSDPRSTIRLFRLLKQLQPDVLVTYLIYADLLGRAVGRAVGIPRIISSQRSSHVGRAYLRIPDILTSPLVSSYTVQTHHAATHLPLINQQKKHIIPNAVESHQSSYHSPDSAHHPHHLTITCVASLKPGKGHTLLLQAAANLKNKGLKFKIALAGHGQLQQVLEQQMKNLKLDNTVTFLGLVDDIQGLLAQTDIFVLPTEGEGMSNALLEAMASGLPCITSDIPVNHELIQNQKTGLLFANKDADDLANKLHLLINNQALRQRLGQAAHAHVAQHHNIAVISNQWKVLLSQ